MTSTSRDNRVASILAEPWNRRRTGALATEPGVTNGELPKVEDPVTLLPGKCVPGTVGPSSRVVSGGGAESFWICAAATSGFTTTLLAFNWTVGRRPASRPR